MLKWVEKNSEKVFTYFLFISVTYLLVFSSIKLFKNLYEDHVSSFWVHNFDCGSGYVMASYKGINTVGSCVNVGVFEQSEIIKCYQEVAIDGNHRGGELEIYRNGSFTVSGECKEIK